MTFPEQVEYEIDVEDFGDGRIRVSISMVPRGEEAFVELKNASRVKLLNHARDMLNAAILFEGYNDP